MVIGKSYEDFLAIVNTRNLDIIIQDDSNHYHLIAKDGIVFYETYIVKDNGPQQLNFETHHINTTYTFFPDAGISTGSTSSITTNTTIFTKPYDSLMVLTKNDCGDPLTIKSTRYGVDSQLATITYDLDGDFQSVSVSDL